MMTTGKRVGARPIQKMGWLKLVWISTLLLAVGGWLPVSAQLSIPNTVVLPPMQMRLPYVVGEAAEINLCPTVSVNSYETTSILGNPRNPAHAPIFDPDLNLLVRGYIQTPALLEIIAINGPTDDDAPQLAHIFRPVRVPTFSAVHQVHDWNWACCPGGEKGNPINHPEVTLVEMQTTPGELVYPPRRNANINRDFVAMVLFAETYRITFTYTRDDSPAQGYVVHLENFCVDPALLTLYQAMHTAGRNDMPALRRSDSIGTALGSSVLVAVRDTGSFMDPRSGKDWWQDTVRARLAAQAIPLTAP